MAHQLKQMHLASSISVNSNFSDNDAYGSLPSGPISDHQRAALDQRDCRLKQQIRILKLISRVIATVIAAVTLSTLTMTLVKFLQTRNVYYDVDGQQRTAWAKDPIVWYTYMYFGVAAVSFLLNFAILVAYSRGVKQANRVAKVQSAWSYLITFGELVLWGVSTAVYRYGKEPVGGKFRDLWGWTCSDSAEKLQDQLTDVNFQKYCNIQTTSFGSGIGNTATALLSGITLFLAVRRQRSKKAVKRAAYGGEIDREPLRQ